MDIEKYLVILKGKDKTDVVQSYEYTGRYKVNVRFYKTNKTYTYLKRDFKFYLNPVEINIDEKFKSLVTGDIYNVEKILKFGDYCKIIFSNGSSKTVPSLELNLTEKVGQVSEDRFHYFKEISKIVSVRTEEGTALLTREYEKVNFVEKNTALYQYLNPQDNRIISSKNDVPLIFPFGSNKSQYEAIQNAMNHQISIIEGPPGTGKTQTILNIIANIIARGKTVAVVSNNNAATANVYEKLEHNGYGFICAVLGKKENKEKFIENQNLIRSQFAENPDVSIQDIFELNKKLNQVFDCSNQRAIAKEMLEEIKIEHEYFSRNEKNISMMKIRSLLNIKSNELMKLQAELQDIERKGAKIGLWYKVRAIVLYGIGDFKYYKLPVNQIIQAYNKLYYLCREYELRKNINELVSKLNELKSESLLDELKRQSDAYLRIFLQHKYSDNNCRKKYTLGDLYVHSADFMKDYPVVFSTTYSIKECMNPDYKYDYIIMDEASQVDLITGTLALSCAKNAVIVGDRKQLPNVITNENRREIEELTMKYRIADSYNFLKECFLTSVINSIKNVPQVLLKEHYRCHPKIIQFSNKKFYNDELIILTENRNEKDVLKVYVTVDGNHARGHFNQRQMEVIRDEVLPELNEKVSLNQIGIVSPYNAQKDGLMDLKMDDEIKIDTVHKYQGREKDAIVITTVDNEISEFVDDPKLLNVAVTRAKKYLRLVVSKEICNTNSNLNDLIKYIQYNNFELVESKIKSIYDLLYKTNRKARLDFLKGKKRISEYDSENITYNVIKNIIEKNKWSNLDLVSFIPLKSILKDFDSLNDDEKKYALNDWTHIDFVVYNKMDKKMVMAIEVDGYYFHKKGTRQSQRDEMKNMILSKYGIQLIRLSTVGSGEEKILEKNMREIIAINGDSNK